MLRLKLSDLKNSTVIPTSLPEICWDINDGQLTMLDNWLQILSESSLWKALMENGLASNSQLVLDSMTPSGIDYGLIESRILAHLLSTNTKPLDPKSVRAALYFSGLDPWRIYDQFELYRSLYGSNRSYDSMDTVSSNAPTNTIECPFSYLNSLCHVTMANPTARSRRWGDIWEEKS